VESDAYVQHDEQLLEIFLEESEKNLETGEEALQRWRHHPDDEEALAELQRTLHTLKGGARMADLAPIGDLAHAVESLVIAIAEKRPDRSAEAFEAVQAAHDRLGSMLEDVSGRRPLTCEADLIARLRAFHATPEVADVPRDGQPSDSEPTRAGTTVPVTDSEDEIVAVFVEEAALILENIDSTLHAWKEEPHELAVMEPLQRYLHTLKGGARMAGFSAMGDLAHSVESLAEQISSGVVEINDPTVSLMREACDSLAAMFDRVERRQQITAVPGLVERLEALSEGDTGTNTPVGDLSENTVPAESGEYEHGVVRRGEERRATSRTSHELVRVSADLLDNMVNFAGEVSIYRSRLEQQIGAYRFNLVEMEQTVSRLRDQLRKLEIETEAQILFRYEKEGLSGHAEFDPLELDRYSHMQELSRSLLESVGDLASIQNLLESVTRESETLLLQQSRVNTELQEGLMRTRMVPFLGLAPRMRRIVRQLCHELGKKAELELSGADGEMDRTVVDRLIAPIEHMLRNAVSHGIEAPELRRQNGKPEAGMIRIRLEREGTDIVLNIADDGAGIDLSAIRRKAVERGLMQPETDLPDAEVLQFILETGFSTADRVTQVAGRGVGMDVVNSEVKQLGGVLRIESEPGQGTSFTIRLPFTLALNQALLIEVGEDTYAVPLSTIEGVVRMDAARIKSFYADPEARFEYGGMAYEVRHLGTTLGGAQARLESDSVTLPVLLARTGERCVGFQVEKLLGNREIVVKSVGPQISTVTGITGATILGDGRVVMILDVASLLRGTIPPVAPRVLETAPSADRGGPVTVMIVDDSITVRKVTTRLLERNEMQVIAAKDGLDAVALLQDHVPDIILLDIEMPRMDGFEVATHVRNEDRLRGIPIIMITSRTGDKHRQRAMQVGVNRYLGKPFQENDLVGTIRELLNESGSTEVASDA
jgi:chemosensory pili system protein ChpA (sensor histidine kinase/response regulator)